MPSAIAGLGWWRNRGTIALPGYSVFDNPWAGVKTSTATWTRAQDSTALSGGFAYVEPNAVNSEFTSDAWFATGTYKVAVLFRSGTNYGIDSIQLDGVTKGTIDFYAAGTTNNNYSEVTSIALTAGLKVIKHLAASKNASSTGYYIVTHTQAWIRTAS